MGNDTLLKGVSLQCMIYVKDWTKERTGLSLNEMSREPEDRVAWRKHVRRGDTTD